MKIAIIGSSSNNTFGIGKNYYQFAEYVLDGEVIILTSSMSEGTIRSLIPSIDLLILPGGADLSAHLYGKRPHPFNTNPDLHKEDFFVNRLSMFVEANVAIFGICLGFQMLNVFCGGTLTQHVNTGLHQKETRYSEAHDVLVDYLGSRSTVPVNSHHHQAVRLADLGRELTITAISDEYNKKVPSVSRDRSPIVEAFIHESKPIAGVQWHPEEWNDFHSHDLISSIIDRSKALRIDRLELAQNV